MLKKILKSPWCWCAITCVVLFVFSGFLIRGNALNALIPGGILGWIFLGRDCPALVAFPHCAARGIRRVAAVG